MIGSAKRSVRVCILLLVRASHICRIALLVLSLVFIYLLAQLLMNQGFKYCKGWEGGLSLSSEAFFSSLARNMFSRRSGNLALLGRCIAGYRDYSFPEHCCSKIRGTQRDGDRNFFPLCPRQKLNDKESRYITVHSISQLAV